jgi:hypothetical protein
MAYAIPSSLDWSGKPATWNEKYDATANNGLTCTITGYGQGDIGCVSSLCNTLIFYAAANKVPASAADTDDNSDRGGKALRLANKLMSAQWNTARDEVGIAYEDHNDSLKRMFEQTVYIPEGFDGEMPDGSPLRPKVTFADMRQTYAKDEMFQECKKIWEDTHSTHTYTYKLHRFWHMGDALMTTGTMALLYPEVKPINNIDPTDPSEDPQTTTTTAQQSGDRLWGDANLDQKVTVADATAILQSIANADKYTLKPDGKLNADVIDNGDGPTAKDALAIQMMDAKLISQSDFPTTSEKLASLKG